ncbi:MAG: hypothetical protein ABIH63_01365 [archaeon]
MEFDRRYLLVFLLFFIVGLFLMAFFSTEIIFHDTPEYIEVTKGLAGYTTKGIYTTHSFVYSFFVAQFVKLFPSFLTIKVLNLSWLVLTSLLLYFFFRDKRAFLLWVFSPLVWTLSIQYSPVLPASFFVFLMYVMFVRWESTNKRSYFVVSALSGGLAFSLYEPVLIILAFFMLSFFFRKSFLSALLFVLLMLPTFAVRLLVDYHITGFPIYSLIRYFGTNTAVILGLNQGTKGFLHGLFFPQAYMIIFIIAPLLFLFYRVDFSKNKALILFVLLNSLFFFVRGGLIKYFLLFTPFIFLLLGPVMKKKAWVINSVLSVFIIVLLLYPHFGPDPYVSVNREMLQIRSEFPSDKYIDGADLNLYLWDNSYSFYRLEEYFYAVEGKDYSSNYRVVVPNKGLDLFQVLELNAVLRLTYKEDVLFSPLIVRKGWKPLENFELGKCYDYLCVYTKVKNEV